MLVIEGGSRAHIVGSAVTHSIEILHLNINMRLTMQTDYPLLQSEVAAFAQWVLIIGDGTAPAVARKENRSLHG